MRLSNSQRLHILIAEDNHINQQLLLLMLQNLGYQADIANNGREAIAALHTKNYDILLMDIEMPEMDGLSATQYICQHWIPQERPYIIAFSTLVMAENWTKYRQAGMNNYLAKPTQMDDLQEMLQLAA